MKNEGNPPAGPKKKPAPTHGGHRERVKEMFLKTGLDSFSPHAVLELLLYYAIPHKDTNPVAHELIRRFGSLAGVFDAPVEELRKVDGIGDSAAVLLKMIPELCRAYEESLERGRRMTCDYDEAGRLFVKKSIGRQNEVVMLMLLDSRERILFCDTVVEGRATAANIYIKTIVRLAVRYNAVMPSLRTTTPAGSACRRSRTSTRRAGSTTRSKPSRCA